MPIGYPSVYPLYLAKRQGPFATLGLAEDTWALNEHVLGDEHFLQQCLDIDREREAMFFDWLDKVQRGLCVVRVRRHRPHAAHVLARHRPERIPPAPSIPSLRGGTSSRIFIGAWTIWSAGPWRSAGARTSC